MIIFRVRPASVSVREESFCAESGVLLIVAITILDKDEARWCRTMVPVSSSSNTDLKIPQLNREEVHLGLLKGSGTTFGPTHYWNGF